MKQKTAVTLISLIPVLIILVSTFSPEIVSLTANNGEKEIYGLPMVEKSSYGDFNYKLLTEYIERKIYVPNYDANIIITPSEPTIHTGDILRFKINIEDTGILPLDKPYFYVYIVDSKDELRGCFPNCAFDNSKYLKKWDTTSRPISSSGSYYNLNIPILPIKINETLFGFYVDALVKGHGIYRFESGTTLYSSEDVNFYYSFPTDNVGIWKIYVLTFNEEYLSREGSSLFNDYDRNNKNDLVNYGQNIVTVKGTEENISNDTNGFMLFIKIIAAFIGSILTYVAIYFPLRKRYDKFILFIKDVYNKKEFYIGLLIILLLFIIIQYFL